MRNFVIVAVLAAIGVGAWMLLGGEDTSQTDPYQDDQADQGDPEGDPKLKGMRADGEPDPDANDNPRRGEIVGEVRLAGAPAPARVDLRLVTPIGSTGLAATFEALGSAFIKRLMSGGVATGGVLASTDAGADGTFRFKGLGPGLYELRARDAENRTAGINASIPADGARVRTTLELPSGDVTLRGKVVFDDGTPFRGAVIVSPAGEQMSPFMPARGPQTQTEPDGSFTIGGLAPGVVLVNAVQPGAVRAMGRPIKLPYTEGDYVLTIGASGSAITGKVVQADDQTPIEGATVLAGGGNPGTGFLIRSTSTDAEGRFTINVPGVDGGMIAMADGFAQQMVNLRRDRPDDLVVALQRLGTVRGTLTIKGGGTPGAGIPVMAVPAGGMRGFTFPVATKTAADGSYELSGVFPGQAIICACGEGWVSEGFGNFGRRQPSGGALVAVKPGGEHEMDLTVEKAGVVKGRVRLDDGKAVAGAVVSLKREGDMLDGLGQMLGFGSAVATAVTDRDGRYVLDSVIPGTESWVGVEAVGHAPARSDRFSVAGGQAHELDVTLESPRWVTVTVVDAETKKPIANAIVMGMRKGEDDNRILMPGGPGEVFHTDANGVARLGPYGKGILGARASAVGYLDQDDAHWFAGETGNIEGTLTLIRGHTISGRVVVPEGVRVTQVEVQARRTGGGWQREEAAPKADGTFVIEGLQPGTYRLHARAVLSGNRRFEARREDVETGTSDVVLELVEEERGSILVVRVKGAGGGAITQARITMITQRSGGGSTSSSSRDLTGGRASFELDDDKDRDELWIEVTGVQNGQGAAHRHGPLPVEGGDLEITLPPAQTIRGRVVSGGKPVSGARVVAEVTATDEWRRDEHGETLTAKDGTFAIEGLGAHEYKLRVEPPAKFATPDTVVAKGGATAVTFDLEAGVEAAITVLDAAGKPVSGARVNANIALSKEARDKLTWRERNRRNRNALTDAKGVATLVGLDADATYHLVVSPPNGREDVRGLTLNDWRPAAETVRLEEAFVIVGRVFDPRGKPFTKGQVRARMLADTKRSLRGKVDTSGNFRIARVPPGRYLLTYEAEGGSRGPIAVARPGSGDDAKKEQGLAVEAGAKNVRLVWDLGPTIEVRITNWPSENRWTNANLSAETESGRSPSTWTEVGRDGVVRFHGLDPKVTYTLAVGGSGDGRYLLLKGLRPGDVKSARMEKGQTLRGRVIVPPEAAGGRLNVSLQVAGMGLGARPDKSGRFEIKGVPPGTWTVQAWARKDKQHFHGEAEASADREVVITLRARN